MKFCERVLLPFSRFEANLHFVSTISATLEPHPDGTLHLPLPAELRHRRIRLEATVVAADEPGPVRATPDMLRERKEALAALRALGGLKDIIPDPVAWQREIRQDRPLPGRE